MSNIGGPSALGFGGGSFANGGGGFLDAMKNFGSSIGKGFEGFGNFMGGKGGQGLMDLGSLAFMKNAMDMQGDQIGLLKNQDNRASTAQNLQTGNQLSLALQMTTPGTAEHQRIKDAIDQGTYKV